MSADILSAIDRAIGCQTCEGDLTGSVSDDFCSEACQARWHSSRVGAEPASPFEHFRQRYALGANPYGYIDCAYRFEFGGPAIRSFAERLAAMNAAVAQSFAGLASTARAAAAAATGMGETLRAAQEAEGARTRMGFEISGAWVDEVSWDAVVEEYSVLDPKAHALELRRNRNTGPARQARAPRAINPRRSR